MGDSIFLSYARADDEPFVRGLYDQLRAEGFDVWFDRECMPSRALTFLQEIRDEIRSRDRLLVVLGPQALRSDYVRAEWQAALVDGKIVNPVLRGGDYDLVPSELKNLHCPDVRPEREADDALAEVLRVLRDPVPPLGALFGAVPAPPAHFQPRPDDLSRLAELVLYEVEHPVVLDTPLRTTVLHGMGGVGKSVVAAALARSTTTRRVFMDGVVWASLSPTSTPADIVRTVLATVSRPVAPNTGLGEAVTRLRDWLEERRCLIVLDNVWSVAQVMPLVQAISPVSRLLVTSRDEGLATSLGSSTQRLDTLSPEAALDVLADWVGSERDALPDEARAVATQCGGLPFALALQGALARDGVLWKDLLEALREADLSFARQHLGDYPYVDVLAAIEVSIDQLRAADAPAADRMLELGAFNWEEGVPTAALLAFWEHRADLSGRHGRRLLVELERKALIRVDESSPIVRIHDLVADYLRAKGTGEGLDEDLLDFYRSRCGEDWPSGPDDGYFHRHLVDHLAAASEGRLEVHRLLRLTTAHGRNAWFEASDRAGHLDAYRRQLERRIHDPGLGIEGMTLVAAQLASVGSITGTMPPGLRRALVDSGGWTSEQALNSLRQVMDPVTRARGLVSLLRDGDGDGDGDEKVLEEAIMAARQIEDELSSDLAPLLAALARHGRTAEALSLARRTGVADERTKALAAIVPHLPAPEKSEVLSEAIDVASNTGAIFRAAALEPILPHLSKSAIEDVEARAVLPLKGPFAKGSCQTSIVRRLVELGEGEEAWRRAGDVADPLSRAEALIACLPTRPAAARDGVVEEVLDGLFSVDRKAMEEGLEQEMEDLPAMLRGFMPHYIATQPVRSSLLAEAGGWLSPVETQRVVDTLVEADDTLFAAEGAAALAPVLATATRSHLFHTLAPRVAAFAQNTGVGRGEEGVRARAALLRLAPAEHRPEVLDGLLEAAGREDPGSTMRAIAPLLEGPDVDRAIEAIDRIEEPEARAAAIDGIVSQASPEQLRRAAAVVSTIRDEQSILFAAAAMAGSLDRPVQVDLLHRASRQPEYPRARLVALLAPALHEDDLPLAMEIAESVDHPGSLAEILLPALARRAAEPERDRLLRRAIDIAAAMTDPERRVWALEAMIDQLEYQLQQAALDAFVQGEREMDDDWLTFGRGLLYAVVAPHRPDPSRRELIEQALALVPELDEADLRRSLLSRLAGHLDPAQWQSACAHIASEADPYERAITCGFVLSDAPEDVRPALVQEAFREFEDITETDFSSLREQQEGAAARILAYSADPLEKLPLIDRMESPAWKRAALREYCLALNPGDLPALEPLLETLDDPRDRASLELAMARRLSGGARTRLLEQALGHALEGTASLWHDRLLPELSEALSALPSDDLADLWQAHLPRLADMSREQMAAQVHGLAPMIEGAGAGPVTAQALLDAQGWWP
jgi:hypothetical protein